MSQADAFERLGCLPETASGDQVDAVYSARLAETEDLLCGDLYADQRVGCELAEQRVGHGETGMSSVSRWATLSLATTTTPA